ncbi:hypothetical protein AB0L70_06805 [Kribbella sp. NPDC051952]|uniref:hypothetical protein n=1 Tax=Kribbella sp. NPDC051952 TaxID=3154851 RepID=UPI00342496A4
MGLVALLVVNSTQTGPTAPTAGAAPSATQPAETSKTPPETVPVPTPEPTAPETTAPEPTEPPKPTATAQLNAVYAGRTANREATVAVAVKGAKAAAYICDGQSLEAWLTGTYTAGQLNLRSKTGERITATLSKNAVTGTLTLSGKTLRFTIAQAGPPAGLYRAKNSKSTIGWIVLPDGSQVGIDNDGSPAAAPRLDPTSRQATVGGASVTAQSITGDETF